MMVTNGIFHEISHLTFIRQFYHLLRPAEIGLRLIAHQRTLGHEIARQIASKFKDRDGSLLHKTSDAHTDARLEMGVEFILLHHIEGNGAMGKQHLTRFRIDVRGIGLEP